MKLMQVTEIRLYSSFKCSSDYRHMGFLYLHLHLADAFIQSDLQGIQAIHFLSVRVFPGNRTHNLCAANAMLQPLSHRNT